MSLENGKANPRAVHFDTKTTLWIIFSALALAAGLFVWGMNMQERVGVVENAQEALEERTHLQNVALSNRIDARAKISDREISRIESRFDTLDATLVRIEDKLDQKADRNGN